MTPTRRWLALLLALAASLAALPTRASEVRDGAKMFSARAIREAEAVLDRSGVVIETIPTLGGRSPEAEVEARARRETNAQVYVLIARAENSLRFEERDHRFTPAQAKAIRAAFFEGFNAKDFDSGLVAGSRAIASAVSTWSRRPATPPVRFPPAPAPARRGGGFSFLITIGLIILAVVVGMRLLGGLFGGNRAGYGPPRPGMGGYGPGYGGGYGGGGGGFFSSLMGGIGGAMAGNWIYDRMRGHDSYGGGYTGGETAGTDPVAPDEAGWGGMGGGEWGGGDAGGGDIGGGGDWGGGGGGDWGGGGGGDWGGGGGGGDWS